MALLLKPHARVLLALALLGCGRSDRNPASSTQSGTASIGYSAAHALVLRVPRAGGPPRVFAYPRIDSLVWSATVAAPSPALVLAFNEDGGIAYEDTRGRPVLLELRLGTVDVASSRKLTGLSSANGNAIFGIAANGDVIRTTPVGDWTFKPPAPAHAVFPQPDGGLLLAVGDAADRKLLKLRPPEKRVIQEIAFPVASHTVSTQLGDRLYLAVDSGLAVLRTRTMDWAPTIRLPEPIAVMTSTPSGDRVFALTESRRVISVIDRFRDRVTAQFELPGKADDLRIDPLGRYLLARAAEGDSIWIVAIGTQRVIGGLRGAWRSDLPFVGYDGNVVIASGDDVLLVEAETLRQHSRIRGGARDYWYPFLWDGFRPRSASLDEPVLFESIVTDSTLPDTIALSDSVGIVDETAASQGFLVSFAAFLSEDRAKDLASRIRVGGENARVVTSSRDGARIYRVVLGPYLTRQEADRAGRDSRHSFWVYEGLP